MAKTPKAGLDALLRPEDSILLLIDHQPPPNVDRSERRIDPDGRRCDEKLCFARLKIDFRGLVPVKSK